MEIWLKINGQEARYRAIDVIDSALNLAHSESPGAHERFYAMNPRFCRHVVRAGLRDLRRPSSAEHILALLAHIPVARTMSSGVEVSETMDYNVFQASLASFRTLLCSQESIHVADGWYRYVLFMALGACIFINVNDSDYIRLSRGGNPRLNPMLAEEDLYQVVCIVNFYIEASLRPMSSDTLQTFKTMLGAS